jgi:hypothetical protein
VAHERYPPLATRGGFLPYFSSVQFGPEVWVARLPRQGSRAALKKVLGKPLATTPFLQEWAVPLDAARAVGLYVQRDDLGSVFWRRVPLGARLRGARSPRRPHARVAAAAGPAGARRRAAAQREKTPTALLDWFPLGWWRGHVKDRPGLREAVKSWLDGLSIEPLLEALGELADPDSPRFRQPAVFDDWASFERCVPVLDAFFRKWRARQRR